MSKSKLHSMEYLNYHAFGKVSSIGVLTIAGNNRKLCFVDSPAMLNAVADRPFAYPDAEIYIGNIITRIDDKVGKRVFSFCQLIEFGNTKNKSLSFFISASYLSAFFH